MAEEDKIMTASNKLTKRGNPISAPKSCLEKMIAGGYEYVTWENSFAGARFIARKSFVEQKALNKAYNALEGEVVKLGTNLTVDEVMFELDAHQIDEIEFKEGMSKESKKVSRTELNIISEVLYNPEFDCSIFWPKKVETV